MIAEPFRWIGQPVCRVEDGHFIDDLDPLPGCKVAAIVRSPYAHARIQRIDAQAALALPGVVGVITGADVQREMRPFPVGVPVADSRYLAEDAAELVQVEYDPLPAVMDLEAAIQPGSPLLHENIGTNIANHRIFAFGDWEQALASAPRTII